ncbi:MAG: cadherin repeat domain-containing protein, partial [Ekhidna sp.]|nr:cadherin repeat domain-containing protein [Ekhidna sp.]
IFFLRIILFSIFGLALVACGDDDDKEELVNTAPVMSDQSFTIAEDAETGAAMGTMTATDADGDAMTFSITSGNTGNAFAINGRTGAISTTKALDYETTPTYTLGVSVSDGKLSGTADITIEVTDVNEPPVFSATGPFTVAEDIAIGTVVGNLEAADPEMDALTFAIASGNTGDAFFIDPFTGDINTTVALDYETTATYTLAMKVSDGILESTADVTITVTDVDENTAPVMADQTFTIAEDAGRGTVIGTIVASDAEMNSLTFAITSGNTGDVFAINPSSGAITVAGTLDFETDPNYTLTISVSDGNLSATADITVNVTDVNTAPAIADQTFSVAENATNGTTVGTIAASDAEMDRLTFAIFSGNTGNVFALDASTGTLSANGALDYETTMSYTLRVSVSDGSLSTDASITVNVTNVNDAPVMADQSFSVTEDAGSRTVIGTIAASDAEMNRLTFTITSGNTGNVFALDASTGALSANGALDYET